MTYAICTQPLQPIMEILPIYKITDYPLENRDYKPFAQMRTCLTPTNLILEMWAFEMVPTPESCLTAVFSVSNSDKLLFAECLSGGKTCCYVKTPSGRKSLSVISHSLKGEDLQGIFWGIRFEIPRTIFTQTFGEQVLDCGNTLLCNIYKLSANADKPHKGSLYPADFAGGREYALGSLAPFKIINY